MARICIELANAFFHLDRERMVKAASIGPGFVYVFTDHDQDWNFGLADIQGPVKFADSLVRRDLKERRELAEGDRLWLYQVHKHGDRFQAVYGILSGERYAALNRLYLEKHDGMALFDGVSVALGLLRQARNGKPKAVVVQAADAAVVAMGDNRHCHWLVRMVVQDDNLDDILKRVQAEAEWRKITLHGIDVVRPLAGQSSQALPAATGRWPYKTYFLGDRQISSDLEALLPRLPLGFGPVTRQEALYRPLERTEPLLWCGLAAAGLAMFLYGAWLHGNTQTLRAKTGALQAQSAIHARIDPRESPVWNQLTLFRDELGDALNRPLAGEALRRLAEGIGSTARIENITITEHELGLNVRIQGGLPPGLDSGPLFQEMLLGMTSQGLSVSERQLEIGPQGTTFVITAMLHAALPTPEIGVLTGKGG
jgi:hypothetical protein